MTIHEAVVKTQGNGPGWFNRLSANYAQTLLEPGEIVIAAVVANIFTRKERFPGVVALTSRRVLAVCGLPGIRRCISCTPESLKTCVEKPTAIRYQASFSDGDSAFSITVDPDTGERFSRQIAVLTGRAAEFDAVGAGESSALFNPTLVRNQRRARRDKERKRQDTAEKQARVVDTDPKVIAARLVAEFDKDYDEESGCPEYQEEESEGADQ